MTTPYFTITLKARQTLFLKHLSGFLYDLYTVKRFVFGSAACLNNNY